MATTQGGSIGEVSGGAIVEAISGSVGGVLAGVTVSSTAKTKHGFFSWDHIKGARHFATLARDTEAKGDKSEAVQAEHRAYVSGAVLLAAAFSEASINELYLEANDPGSFNTTLAGLATTQIETLASLWNKVEGERYSYSVLKKYQAALAACGKATFADPGEPFTGTEGLAWLRNALMHSKPEWSDELDVHKKLEARLKDRFAPNSLVPEGLMWFPHLCLGAGCAEWAVHQAEEFSEQFCGRMGIRSRLPPKSA